MRTFNERFQVGIFTRAGFSLLGGYGQGVFFYRKDVKLNVRLLFMYCSGCIQFGYAGFIYNPCNFSMLMIVLMLMF